MSGLANYLTSQSRKRKMLTASTEKVRGLDDREKQMQV